MKTKTLVIGGLLAVVAALFQVMPALFSEVFVFLTIFSAVPIYIVSRINPKAGILSYIVAGLIIMMISAHEALFFLCTNGIVGISLGICSYYTNRKIFIFSISSLMLMITLSIMNYGLGIPVFGAKIPGVMVVQLLILLLFSLLYIVIYYYFTNLVYGIFKRINI